MTQSPTLIGALGRHRVVRIVRGLTALCIVASAPLVTRAVHAADRTTLAGRWTAGAMSERWNIGDWGPACGPQPTAREMPGGPVTIKEDGAELIVTGGGRTFRTSDCWEQHPGVSRGSHSVSERAWRTRCNSAPSDPRQTTVVTSVTAADTTIALDETGEYQFRIDGQNCTASVRRNRTFTLVQREGEAPAASASVAPPNGAPGASSAGKTSTSANPSAPRCAVVGEPIRLEVRPPRKVLRPGERFAFRTLGIDAEGCAADMRANWSIVSASAASKVNLNGATVEVAEDAQDGTVELGIALGGRSARAVVEVATAARYDALLATGADAGVAPETASATAVASGSLGTSTAVAQDGARTRKTAFVAIIGTLALALASLGFYLFRRNALAHRTQHHALDDFAGARIAHADGDVLTSAPALAVGAAGAVRAMRPMHAAHAVVCPACGAEFPAGSTFCPHDGSRLGPPPLVSFQGPSTAVTGGICPACERSYEPPNRTCPVHGDVLVPAAAYRATNPRAPAPAERGKICPSCGGRYGPPAAFCGKDGTALVLVN